MLDLAEVCTTVNMAYISIVLNVTADCAQSAQHPLETWVCGVVDGCDACSILCPGDVWRPWSCISFAMLC